MSLRKPSKKDLVVGKTVEIYDGEGNLKGKAKLLRRKPSRFIQDDLPYIRYEKKNTTQQPTCYFWAQERWEVEWVEHNYYRPGDRNCVMVHYFLTMTTDYPSFVDINTIGNKGVSLDGLFIFIEERGVLTLNGEAYSQEAVKALKRVKKAFNGEIIIYDHNPLQVKERWDIAKLPFRVFDFLSTEVSFEEAIANYLETTEWTDYTILAGESHVKNTRTIQCDTSRGLILKKNIHGKT